MNVFSPCHRELKPDIKGRSLIVVINHFISSVCVMPCGMGVATWPGCRGIREPDPSFMRCHHKLFTVQCGGYACPSVCSIFEKYPGLSNVVFSLGLTL